MTATEQMTAAELHATMQKLTEHLVKLRDAAQAHVDAGEPGDSVHALNRGVRTGYNVALDALWHYTRGEHGQAAGGDGS